MKSCGHDPVKYSNRSSWQASPGSFRNTRDFLDALACRQQRVVAVKIFPNPGEREHGSKAVLSRNPRGAGTSHQETRNSRLSLVRVVPDSNRLGISISWDIRPKTLEARVCVEVSLPRLRSGLLVLESLDLSRVSCWQRL